jgi:uncharacterized RDD family membrane protein YckC
VDDDGTVIASPASGPADPTDVGWRRLVAAVIDVGIAVVISVPAYVLLSEDTYRYDSFRNELTVSRELTAVGAVLFYGFWVAYGVGVFVLQRGLTGRTVGTMALGLAVVDIEGRPIGPGHAVVRSVIGLVDYLPCCLPLVGIITIFTTTAHQRVGDMAARSYVIDSLRAGEPVLVPGRPAFHPAAPGHLPAPPVGWTPPPGPASSPARQGGPPMPPPMRTPGPSSPTPVPREAEPVVQAPTPPPATPTPTPRWDDDRGAYMAWDPLRRQWLQFDQASQQWLEYDLVTRRWRPVR